MTQITPAQALGLLEQATQPGVQAGLKRQDYVNLQIALEVLERFITENSPNAKPSVAEKVAE